MFSKLVFIGISLASLTSQASTLSTPDHANKDQELLQTQAVLADKKQIQEDENRAVDFLAGDNEEQQIRLKKALHTKISPAQRAIWTHFVATEMNIILDTSDPARS